MAAFSLWGGWSVGLIAGSITAFAALCAAIWTRVRLPAGPSPADAWHRWADYVFVACAHAAVSAVAVWAVFFALQRGFLGLELTAGWAALIIVIVVGLGFAWSAATSAQASTRRHVTHLIFGVAAAMFISMSTTDQHQWWKSQFSILGTVDTPSGTLFNGALIVTGFYLVALAVYVRADLTALHQAGALRHRRAALGMSAGYVAAGVGFVGVGCVPLNRDLSWHNTFGITLVVAPLLLMLASHWLLAGLPRRLVLASYVCAAGIATSVVLCRPLNIVNITVMEVVTFALAFSWVCGVLRAVANLSDRASSPGGAQTRDLSR